MHACLESFIHMDVDKFKDWFYTRIEHFSLRWNQLMASGSWYKSFAELDVSEREGVSFQRTLQKRRSRIAIIAPHGGGIEPGTSEIAYAVAGSQFSYYTFEGLKPRGNEILHIPSTSFDEPKCLQLVQDSEIVIAMHGCDGEEKVIHVGGLHVELKTRLIQSLAQDGFEARLAEVGLSGNQIQNICNRGQSNQGIQLEITTGLRRAMFRKLDQQGRNFSTDIFRRFVTSVRKELLLAAKELKL